MLRGAYWMLHVIIIITSLTSVVVVIVIVCKRGSLTGTSPYPYPYMKFPISHYFSLDSVGC